MNAAHVKESENIIDSLFPPGFRIQKAASSLLFYTCIMRYDTLPASILFNKHIGIGVVGGDLVLASSASLPWCFSKSLIGI